MKLKPNKGPYFVQKQANGETFICADSKTGRLEIATVYKESEYGKLSVDENACLLSASWNLLMACERLIYSGILSRDNKHMAAIIEAVDCAKGKD